MFTWPAFEPGVPLEAGKQYLVTGGTESPNSIFLAMGYDIDYAASGWSFQMAIINGALFTGGFGESRYAPVLRVHWRDETTAVSEKIKEIGVVAVSPNPANIKAEVSVDLFEMTSNLEVELLDASGRKVYTKNFEQVKNHRFEIPTADFPTGSYFMKISSERGRNSMKLVVKH